MEVSTKLMLGWALFLFSGALGLWMVLRIAKSSVLFALLSFFFFVPALVPLVKNWGDDEGRDIRVPFFSSIGALGLALMLSWSALMQAQGVHANMSKAPKVAAMNTDMELWCLKGGVLYHPVLGTCVEATPEELETRRRMLEGQAPQMRPGKTQLVMFSTTSCSYCHQARAWLAEHQVAYIEYDLERSPEHNKAFSELGGSGVPFFVYGDQTASGFDKAWLSSVVQPRKTL